MNSTGTGKIRTAKVQLVISMTVFGTLGLFVKNINLASGELALYRACLAAVLLAGYFLVTKQKIDFAGMKKDMIRLLLSGMAMGVNWILLFQAYRYTTVSVATLTYYFAPVLVTVLCPVIFHERLTKKQIFCFVMSTLGLIMIIGVSGLGTGGKSLIGIAFGLGAASFYAAVILLNKSIKNVAGIMRTFVQFIASIILLVPYVCLTGGFHLTGLNHTGIYNLLIVGFFHTGITYCLYFSSLKELKGQEAAILSYIDPLVAVVVSVLILQETLTPWQLIGGCMILGFTIVNELPARAFSLPFNKH